MKFSACKTWALALALALPASGAMAQPLQPPEPKIDLPPVYRVEVIVFRYTDGQSDARPADQPIGFPGLPDPRDIARAVETVEERGLAAAYRLLPLLSGPEIDETTPWLERDGIRLQPIPPMYAQLDDLSSTMRDALRRLEGSDRTEPLAVRGWLQQAERGQRTPRLRIHDDVQLAIELPPARHAKPLFWPFWPPAGALVRDGWPAVLTTLFAPNPAPQLQYRTDAGVRLARRQFLHFEIDLVWQERTQLMPQSRLPDPPALPAWLEPQAQASPEPAAELQPWRIHRMQQSRVIRPGRLEYFDSELLGVLVLLERFEQIVPEVVPDPDPEVVPDIPAERGPDASIADAANRAR